jgi:IS4 transposase
MDLQDGQATIYPCERPFKLVRVDDEETKISYLFATNMPCRPKRLLRRYKTRWGVETSYREHNLSLPRTKSKNYTVRLLYYAVAVCLYNVWCILNVRHHRRGRVIALEVKVSLLLMFLVAFSQTQSMANDPG